MEVRFQLTDAILKYIEGGDLQPVLDLLAQVEDPEILIISDNLNQQVNSYLTDILEKLTSR